MEIVHFPDKDTEALASYGTYTKSQSKLAGEKMHNKQLNDTSFLY